jgi:hypothetical protein
MVMPAMQILHKPEKSIMKSMGEGGGAAACRGKRGRLSAEIQARCQKLEQALSVI